MKELRIIAIAVFAAIVSLASCNKEISTDTPGNVASGKEALSFVGTGEAQSKSFLDFSESANVRWSDDDLIAVFDGTAINQFSIDPGTNTGAAATFSGEVTAGATSLYAVYPYSAAGSLSSSNITVTVPSAQVVGSSANVDPAALVSVGMVDNGAIEFKQVCGLLKIEVTGSEVHSIVVSGNAIAGTATVAGSTGVISSVSSASNSITLTYEGDANFPAGTYYAAVLPGTTSAGNFSIQLVTEYGATWVKTASSAVTFQRLKGMDAGNIDGSASFARHITNKDELFAWGAAMGKESGVTVYIDNDIDCGSDPWPYSGAFDGVLEGQGHKIYNFIAEQSAGACMFGSLTGSINNLIIGSSNGTSWDNVSVFRHAETGKGNTAVYLAPVSLLGDGASMTGVTNFAKVEATSDSDSKVFVGGLVGHLGTNWSATLTDCKNYGTLINNSTYTGDGSNQSRMGGIMAQCNGPLAASGLENHGHLINNNTYCSFVGGLCGDLAGGSVISGTNINDGDISVTGNNTDKYIGGCFGSIRGATISSCTNNGKVSISSSNRTICIGGVVGYLESQAISIKNCHNTNEVSCESSGRTFLGGLVGGCRTANVTGITIDSCTNSGTVVNKKGASDIGGIAGQIWTSNSSAISIVISNCENSGTVCSTVVEGNGGNTNNLNLGGIFGQLDPDSKSIHTVSSCRNSGIISASGALALGRWVALGGIGGAGGKAITLKNCENTGAITFSGAAASPTADLYASGILARFSTSSAARFITIDSCINKGDITSNRENRANYVGGIVGRSQDNGYGSIKDCFNYADLSVTSSMNTSRIGGIVGYNLCQASGNRNYGSVQDGTGSCAGAIAGQNSATMTSNTVCTGVTVNGVASVAAGNTPDPSWVCPNNTGTIACAVVAHSAGE